MRSKLLIAVIVAAGTLYAAHAWAYLDVIRRKSRLVPDLPPYGDELRNLPPDGDSPSTIAAGARGYSGPGWYARPSPDLSRVAVTTSWGGFLGEVILGLFMDRPFIHTVGVWDSAAQRLKHVVSIKEADPGSGIAHRYAWSKDSKALLIYGSGRLPEDFDVLVGDLCLVYLAPSDAFFRLANCPPSWQRSAAERREAP